ncbi:MAG: SusD/RagB family nutrient-binding outer membrane lipoprotein [Cyclobacteriaceae bacterium]|nr:SusD/RagB family nutrient-binding outer membrane lipoprotein [Cyclobacteriaceae bacterium]
MKKLLYIPTIVFLLLIAPMSCNEQLDINVDPLSASTADPNAVLPYILVQYSYRQTTEMNMRTLDVYQHTSQTVGSPRRGVPSNNTTGNTWDNLYNEVMGNTVLIEAEAKAAGSTRNNIAAISIILKALAFHDLTLTWGNVPFTQALNAKDYPTPKFDDQETILRGVVTYLDEAIALIDAMPATGNFNVSWGDLIYGGDMVKWRKYANSLKLRVLMIIRNKNTSVDTEIINTLNEPLIEKSDEAMMLKYPGTPGNNHGYFQRILNVGFNSNEQYNYWAPSPVMRGLLEGDPRLALWCVDGTSGGYLPSNIGSTATAARARYSDNIFRADYPHIWFLPAEISFYRAELAIKGVTTENANTAYRDGMTKSLKFWGQDIPGARKTITDATIATYVNSLTDITTIPSDQALISIGEELYLDSFLRAVEAWTHVRRTKAPNIQSAPGSSISTMLKRFNYPTAEIAANPNTPSNPPTDTPMWFEN